MIFPGASLGANWCGECGRPKLGRLFALSLTGCAECDEVITRHWCAARPSSASVPGGTRWECPECRSAWVVITETGPCGECGQAVARRCWDIAEDRRAAGPRRDPASATQLLRFPPWPLAGALGAEDRDRREWIADVTERLRLVLMGEA